MRFSVANEDRAVLDFQDSRIGDGHSEDVGGKVFEWKEGGRWFKRKFLLTMDLERYSFGSCQDSRDWMRLGHCIM
jgi:hypothetical protein